MSKQDRQGVRTPSDVERKYNIGDIAAKVQNLTKSAELLFTAKTDSLNIENLKLDRTFAEIEEAILNGANVRIKLICSEVSYHIYLQLVSHTRGNEVSFFSYVNNQPFVLRITANQ